MAEFSQSNPFHKSKNTNGLGRPPSVNMMEEPKRLSKSFSKISVMDDGDEDDRRSGDGDEDFDYQDDENDVELDYSALYPDDADIDAVNPDAKPQPVKRNASKQKSPHPPRINYNGAQDPSSSSMFPSPLIVFKHGPNHDHVQCVIIRDRSGISAKMYPTYELRLELTNTPLILAKKMNLNRTSNYHMFDLTKGEAAKSGSKKNPNFMGKLRAKNFQRTEYVLLNNSSSDKEEVAGYLFDRRDVMTSLREGSQPRKLYVTLPHLSPDGFPIAHKITSEDDASSMVNALRTPLVRPRFQYILHTKEPTFINGNYRLNFKGRVSVPSVKNFQIVAQDDINDVLCQFGKVGDDLFHLDFKAPLSAFQAFGLALSQFNL